MLHHRIFSPDHHAVAPIQTPYASAGADIHIVDSLGREFLRAPDIVDVVGITAVNENVALLQVRNEGRDGFIHHRCWDHQPNGSGRV